jgi:rod shape determining protein RodA
MQRFFRFRDVRLGDPLLMGIVIALSIFGVAMVYSAGLVDTPFTLVAGLWRMQLLWFAVGIMMIPVLLAVPSHWFKMGAPIFYVVAVVMLALTLVIGIGVGTAEGVPRWLGFGPVRIQTAEVAKIAVILMLARVLGDRLGPPRHLTDLVKPIGLVLVPIGLVLLQPDLGTAIVFSVILLASLFWAGTPAPLMIFLISPAFALLLAVNTWVWGLWIVVLAGLLVLFKPRLGEGLAVMGVNVAAGTVAAPVWNMLEPYQQNRILVFLDPSIDPRGAGYNLIQSRVAIGSGGLFGKGFGEGSQKRLAFLPEQHTDFIFSVIGEEWGFVGVAAILVAFGLIFWRLVRIASVAADPFASLVPFALFGSWFVHVMVNTGMTIGIMPITGIPLPFLSYGGSFLMINLVALGIVQRIAAEREVVRE